MQYTVRMKRALRFPLRWAGQSRTLLTAVALMAALGACDNVIYGAREGTMEYPGSGAAPGAVPTYVVKNKDTVDSIARRYGVSPQSIIERNRISDPAKIQPGQTLEVPGARVIAPEAASAETQTAAASGLPGSDHVVLYPPVPTSVQRVANVERAQMLVESPSRAALQRFLSSWLAALQATREKGLIRWAIDVDPLAI